MSNEGSLMVLAQRERDVCGKVAPTHAGIPSLVTGRCGGHLQSIHACIEHCRQRKDGRGRWRAEDSCADALQAMGTRPAIADACAAAARRIGAWLWGQPQ